MSDPQWNTRVVEVHGLRTSYLEAGSGAPLVLLHGGEFGAGAELAWESVIGPLAEHRRVIAPDILGFGDSAKVVDFVDGRGWRLRHIAALCALLGIDQADFMGNSMGGAMLISDACAAEPVLPMRSLISICGGGESLDNDHMTALLHFDATEEGMRRIVAALFHDPSFADDDEYVRRRYEASIVPGAWESVASARFRRPGRPSSPPSDPDLGSIRVPVLLVEGERDKLKPSGWAARLAAKIDGARSTVITDSGHCPQLEQPEALLESIRDIIQPKEASK
jgi:pimeloyl-ACP methyl ester carboxylesterase